MSTVSLSFYKARQGLPNVGLTWVDSTTNPIVMGYDNASFWDQGVVYTMPISVTAGYQVTGLNFNIGNIASNDSYENVTVYALIYDYDPVSAFSTEAPSTAVIGRSVAWINGWEGTANIVVNVPCNITSSGTYYMFLTTNGTNSLNPFMKGVTNISCSLSEIRPETPATSISVSTTLYMDQQFQIVWNPSRSDYKYDVWYSFVHHSGMQLIGEKVTGGSMWYTAPSDSLASNIPNATSGSFRIYVYSYNSGGAKVGETSAEFTLSIPTNNRPPTCAAGWASATYEVKAGNCVAGFSEVKATLDTSKITCNYGSTLREVRISCNSFNTSITESGTFNLGKAITGNNIVTITAYDSRGLGTTYTKTIVGKAYYPPSFNSLSVIRCDSSGNESSSGTYYAVTPSVSHTSYDGNNWLLIRTRWQVFGGSYSDYTDIQNNVKSDPVGGGNIATTASYLIEVLAIDSFGQTSTQTRTLTNTSVAATLNLKSNGLGAAFFGLSSTDKELTVFGRVGVNSPTNLGFAQYNADGALLLASGDAWGSGNGIYKGNGDGIKMGADGFCNIAIKSWYGIGFVDGNGDSGVAAGVDCRLGDVYARRDVRAGSWVYGQRLQLESENGNGVVRPKGGASSWGGARDQALVRNADFDASKQAFWPVTSSKCNIGTWEVGSLGNDYYFSFVSDENYNAGNNKAETSIRMGTDGSMFAKYFYAGEGGFFLDNNYLSNSCGTAEPSGWWSGKLYFQYS
jgi:hypothetical protein